MRPDVYQAVADRIIAALEAGTVPWRKPWTGGGPVNIRTGRLYRGINVFLLELAGYKDPRWGTFNAVQESAVDYARKQGRDIVEKKRGNRTTYYEIVDGREVWFNGGVKKDEHGTWIILGKRVRKKHVEEGEDDSYFLWRQYKVFNAEQCEGVPPPPEVEPFQPLERAESIIYGYPGPTISIGGGEASYSQTTDIVRCPAPEHFPLRDNYYATLYHELVHSTGHKDRLDRLESTGFGTGPYAKEELVAEMGAAMLCGIAGLDPHIDQSAAYIANWLQALRNDHRMVVQAGALAQRACDHMLGVKFEESFSAAENREEVAA